MDILGQVLRLPYSIGLWRRFPFGSVKARVLYGIFPYPHYAYGVYWAAVQAARLGIARISAIEFGVAGGRGLIALEQASKVIENEVGVEIDVIGFDSGTGMPEPKDYRDLPHIWREGFYAMDEELLRSRLLDAELVLGNVHSTVAKWLGETRHSPIGFVAFDLDYYSSTKAALEIFCGASGSHLPRVHCYFDDVASNDLGCMNGYVGELLAIEEFNNIGPERKICKIEQLRLCRPRWELWQERMYAFHDFAHPQYNTMLIPSNLKENQLPI